MWVVSDGSDRRSRRLTPSVPWTSSKGTRVGRVGWFRPSGSTADIIRSLDFVQGHPCGSCRMVLIVGVDNQGCPWTKSTERRSPESTADTIRSLDFVQGQPCAPPQRRRAKHQSEQVAKQVASDRRRHEHQSEQVAKQVASGRRRHEHQSEQVAKQVASAQGSPSRAFFASHSAVSRLFSVASGFPVRIASISRPVRCIAFRR